MGNAAVIKPSEDACLSNLKLSELGYETRLWLGDQQPWEFILDVQPDLILLDLSLAGADGWEVLRCLKASRLTGDIPVLLITGYADLGGRAEAEGCAGFLTKPIRLKTLRTAVASLLPPTS